MCFNKISLKRKLKRNSSKIFRILTIVMLIITILLIVFGQRAYNEKISVDDDNRLNEIKMYAHEK